MSKERAEAGVDAGRQRRTDRGYGEMEGGCCAWTGRVVGVVMVMVSGGEDRFRLR